MTTQLTQWLLPCSPSPLAPAPCVAAWSTTRARGTAILVARYERRSDSWGMGPGKRGTRKMCIMERLFL